MIETPIAAKPVEPLCACGSGLRGVRCCSLDLRRIEPALPGAARGEALQALRQAYGAGNAEAARGHAIAILEEAPGHIEALGMLYNLLRGNHKAAGVIAERMAMVHRNDAAARLLVTNHFLVVGDFGRAEFHGRMLVRLGPEALLSHYAMGRAFQGAGKAAAAEHHFRIALTMRPERDQAILIDLEISLAVAIRDQGRLAEARTVFETLAGKYDGNVRILLGWAGLEELARDFQAATVLLDHALELSPGNAHVMLAQAGLLHRLKDAEKALATLDAVAESASRADDRAASMLQKGQVLDSIGRYEEAFAMFDAFKRTLRETSGESYRAQQAASDVEALRDFFIPGRTRLLPRATRREDSAQPLFVVGFPRSGTTLVEQTLASHPNISGGDELPIIHDLVGRVQLLLGSPSPYPAALSELWLGDRAGLVNTLRDLYLNEAAKIGVVHPAKRWFTDKMPLNETHLGLISLMFPESPIVHMIRHPLDVVLSVFSNGLTHGYFCAYALESAAQHYVLISKLVAHYRAALPLRYRAVRYEDLVSDQEAEVRALFDFIGEPFDPATLRFHENARPARTASYAQVTEKLYDRSRYRYRNYLKQLEPVIPILAPEIERLGYVIE